MPNERIQLNSYLYKILMPTSYDDFTVLQLRDEYQIQTNWKTPDPSDARRYVYAQLKKLVEKGLLEKEKRAGQTKHQYKKTRIFYESGLYSKGVITPKPENFTSAEPSQNDDTSSYLYSKLKRYKLELLTAIGESDEYEELYAELPSMGEELKARYRQSKDYSSKMLGKVRAIESLIEQLP